MNAKDALRLLDLLREAGEIDETTHANAHRWLTEPEYKAYRDDVAAMLRPTALIDAFYTTIPFGTGGRRGTVGVGTNRMNERTIAESAQGLAQYILDADPKGALAKRGVVIAYDVRTHSKKFSEIAASVLSAAGVRVYLFDGPRSTPELSFAIRHLKCASGVVITASHNPPTDNGFKAYWSDGGQVVAPHDKGILDRVMAVTAIRKMPLAKAKTAGLVRLVGKEIDDAYLARFPKDLWLADERAVKIVYTPLHGTGVTIIPAALRAMGFSDVMMPREQTRMDGGFPTVPKNYPNPEEPAAMGEAVRLATKIRADIVLATDPDADRLGAFAPDANGEFRYVTGNQMGAALCHFTLTCLRERKAMPKKPFVLTTLVSTQLVRAICERFRVRVTDDLLVGFKFMADILREAEAKGEHENFVYGFEESIGFLRGTFVRDKDSAAAAVTCAQMMARLVAEGRTFWDYLDQLAVEFGFFAEDQFSVFLHGADGMNRMGRIMATLRTSPPREVAGLRVHRVIDRKTNTSRDTTTGAVKKIKGFTGDVVQLWFDDAGKTRLTVRPSGTEPKIKHYAAAYEAVGGERDLARAKKAGTARVKSIMDAMRTIENAIA